MSLFKSTFPIILLLLISSCKTNPPNVNIEIVDTGKIFIQSNVDGASIFIDNLNTGKVTPDTITAKVGNHKIRLEKSGYLPKEINVIVIKDSTKNVEVLMEVSSANKIALIEDFANVSCIPCVTSNKIIESLSKNRYGASKVLVIKYPTNFPSPNDPFYKANKPDCDSRIRYYNIFATPTTIVDGIEKPISTDSMDIISKIDQRLSLQPKFRITVKDTIVNLTLNIEITIDVIDTTGISNKDILVHTVVTEKDIEFQTPPGSNGETKFFDIMRAMLPSSDGETLNNLFPGSAINLQRQVNVNSSWNPDKLRTIIFIQNKNTKEIYQAVSDN
ncbi:MAG: Omp28-related outer membrane protein [Ignavibacteriaceae bacterium]|nr:Omp28-related outer membrane protein [Ignavibacteriaceae bacterium]